MTTTTGGTGALIAGWSRRRRFKIIIDVGLLVGFLAEFVTREGPDYAVHSWVGIILIPIIGLHLAGSIGWIRRVWARRGQDRDFKLGVLNASLGFFAGVCITTGFPIWLDWSAASAWTTVHTVTGFASILAMFAHLWMNRARINQLRLRSDPRGRTITSPGGGR